MANDEEKCLSEADHNAKAPMKKRSKPSRKQRQRQRKCLIHAVSEDNKELPSDSGLNTSLSHNVSEDKSSEAPMKKQCPGDSYVSEDEISAAPMKEEWLSDTDSGFSDFKEKEEASSTFEESSRYEEMMFECNSDAELLSRGRYSWRREDRNSRETYKLVEAGDHPYEESKCIELLAEIGCEDRFLGCSIDNPYAFYAQLSEEEVAMMKGHKEIHRTIPLWNCVFDV